MLGVSANEFIVLLAVAAIVLGPERLPQYTQQLTRLIRELRRMAQGATEQVRNEMGPEFDDVDWRQFDPRQYDPRRIVREALSDTIDPKDPLGVNDVFAPQPRRTAPSANVNRERANGGSSGAESSGPESSGAGSASGQQAGSRSTQTGSQTTSFDPDAT